MSQCHKCDVFYDIIKAMLEDDTKSIKQKVENLSKSFEHTWSDERRREYYETQLRNIKVKNDFITKFYKGE